MPTTRKKPNRKKKPDRFFRSYEEYLREFFPRIVKERDEAETDPRKLGERAADRAIEAFKRAFAGAKRRR